MMQPKGRLTQESNAGRVHAKQLLQNNPNRLSPRLQRLIKALLREPRTVRELADVIPTNNPPEYVRQLKETFGLKIPCERVNFITVDGTASWFGRYHLTAQDVQKVHEMLSSRQSEEGQ